MSNFIYSGLVTDPADVVGEWDRLTDNFLLRIHNGPNIVLSEAALCAVVEQLMDRYAARDPKAADEFLEHLLRVLSGVSDDAYADAPGPWRAEQ